MAVTSIPFFFIIERPAAFGITGQAWYETSRYLASVCGYIGISLLVWELILGTRSISGLYFKNLPEKLRLHSQIGKYGILLIFLHPLFILAQYSEKLPYIFTPILSSEFEEHVTFGRLALGGLLVIWVTSFIARSKIAYRPWKYIHYVAYPVLVAALLHVPEVGHSYKDVAVQFFWWLFVLTTIVCFVLRARHLFGFGKVSYHIVGKKQLSPQVWMYTFKPNEKTLVPMLGQYIYLQRSLVSEEHPFSVLDFSKKTGEFSVAFKVFGKYTKKLLELKEGDTVLVDGPYGVFTNEIAASASRKSVFIAGGIGITPFVRNILSRPKESSMLFYANQSRHTAIFADVLKHHLDTNFVDAYSKDATTHHKPKFITYDVLKAHLKGDIHALKFYICGPKGMMKSVRESLLQLGAKDNNIHIEDFEF